MARFEPTETGSILVVNIHLSSNKAKNFNEKRKTQLETLKRYVIDQADEFNLAAEHCFVCGDFNFGDSFDNEVECQLVNDLFERNGFVDLVRSANTFDPEGNFATAVTAFNPQPRRLDRVLYKSSSERRLQLVNASLVNTAPFKIDLSELSRPVVFEPYLAVQSYTFENRIPINSPERYFILRIFYLFSEFKIFELLNELR